MQRFLRFASALVLAILFTSTGAALADDWTAAKLRGGVFVHVDGGWVKLERGDIVPDDRVVRTQPSGHVQFVRDGEIIDVAPNSQIQIIDRTGRRYTVVEQHYGKVTIDAEARNVQHFAVNTPYLAAVVKGTRFTVISGEGTSRVDVERGTVAVEASASGNSVAVTAGQSVATGPSGEIAVAGEGTFAPVLDRRGSPVLAAVPVAESRRSIFSALSTNAETAASPTSTGESTAASASGNAAGGASGTSGNSSPANSGNAAASGNNGNGSSSGNNGNGNGGDTTSPGSSGNAGNGNAGGNGNGNAGGNGNGNAGGNGNENAGGNGNGNAGGNGNGNAGGNGNGQGNGNGNSGGNGQGNGNGKH